MDFYENFKTHWPGYVGVAVMTGAAIATYYCLRQESDIEKAHKRTELIERTSDELDDLIESLHKAEQKRVIRLVHRTNNKLGSLVRKYERV